MKARLFHFALIILFSALSAQIAVIPDEVTKVATAAGNWLKLETDARAIGMGGAYVAAGKGIGGVTYNPAAIGYIQGSQLYYVKTDYLAETSYNVLAYGTKLSETDFMGLHLFYFDSGKMPVTNKWYPDGTGEEFTVNALAFRFTFAKIMTDRLKIGMSLKYIREAIYTTSMQSFAVDIGSNFDTGIYGVILGMSVTNFGPDVQFHGEGLEQVVDEDDNPDEVLVKKTEQFPLPLTFRLGISNDIIGPNSVFFENEEQRLTLAMDAMNPLDFNLTGNMGIEYAFDELVFARIGTHLGHDTAGFSAGAGAQMTTRAFSIGVDYAYVNYGILKETHQFGINLGF